MTLEDTDAKVFYCSQFNGAATPPVNHCKAGMVGVINGQGNKTFELYTKLAKEVTSVANPSGGAVKGGSFEALGASTTSPSGNSGGSSSPTDTSSGTQPSKTGSGAGTVAVSFGALAAAGAFAAALAF